MDISASVRWRVCRELERVRVIYLSGRALASLGSVNSTVGQKRCVQLLPQMVAGISQLEDWCLFSVMFVCTCSLCTCGSGQLVGVCCLLP